MSDMDAYAVHTLLWHYGPSHEYKPAVRYESLSLEGQPIDVCEELNFIHTLYLYDVHI